MSLIFYLLLVVILGNPLYKYGEKRQIGGNWTIFFSIFFSPLWAWFIASYSKLMTEPPQRINRPFWYFKMILFISLSFFLIYGVIHTLNQIDLGADSYIEKYILRENTNSLIFSTNLLIGFVGASFYVYLKLKQTNNR
jgi:hypothetical protein